MSSSPDTTLAVPVKFCSSCRTSRPVEAFCGAIRLLYMSSITTGLATNLYRAQARRRANGAGARSASPGKRSKSRLRTSRSPPFRPALSFLCSDFLCSGFFVRLSLGYLHSFTLCLCASLLFPLLPRCFFLACLALRRYHGTMLQTENAALRQKLSTATTLVQSQARVALYPLCCALGSSLPLSLCNVSESTRNLVQLTCLHNNLTGDTTAAIRGAVP